MCGYVMLAKWWHPFWVSSLRLYPSSSGLPCSLPSFLPFLSSLLSFSPFIPPKPSSSFLLFHSLVVFSLLVFIAWFCYSIQLCCSPATCSWPVKVLQHPHQPSAIRPPSPQPRAGPKIVAWAWAAPDAWATSNFPCADAGSSFLSVTPIPRQGWWLGASSMELLHNVDGSEWKEHANAATKSICTARFFWKEELEFGCGQSQIFDKLCFSPADFFVKEIWYFLCYI